MLLANPDGGPELNWSSRAVLTTLLLVGCASDKSTPPAGDATPPSTISDLSVRALGPHSVLLGWTSPGDDGTDGRATRYEVRRAPSTVTESNWESATLVASPPVPQAAGRLEQFTLSGLPLGNWFFAARAFDERDNRSAISNVVNAALGDTIPPAAITDLEVTSATATAIGLRWTAPGNDGGSGRATQYELRRSVKEITLDNWNTATRIEGVQAPGPAGTMESFTVMDLPPGNLFFFCVRAVDEAPNLADLSNVVQGATLSAGLTRLTNSSQAAGALGPDWSPDGESIVFYADWAQQFTFQLYTIDPSGGDATRITNIPVGTAFPRWAPDNKRIVFRQFRPLGNDTVSELMVMDARAGAIPSVLVSPGGQKLSRSSWSPDGTKIAYTQLVGDFGSSIAEIYVVDVGGGEPTPLRSAGDKVADLDWSRDGSRLLFVSNQSGNDDIWSMAATGGDEVQLTADPGIDTTPRWSPDGSKIAFSSDRSGNFDIWVMDATGANARQLTIDPGAEQEPSWSPDGRRIVFRNFSTNNVSDLWILDVN